MIRTLLISAVFLISTFNGWSQEYESSTLKIRRISKSTYIHVSYLKTETWGLVPCNGAIYVNEGEAVIMDTPVDDVAAKELKEFITHTLSAEITAVVINHWHEDCLGSLDFFHQSGIRSYAQQITIDSCVKKGLVVPLEGFTDELSLSVGQQSILCQYLGAAHTPGNIICWIPESSALFAGCMLKSLRAKNLGHLADADLGAYPKTLKRLWKGYRNATWVIPGHGQAGGPEIISHCRKLARDIKPD